MNSFEKFKQLHQQASPVLLGNIWDVNSAKVFETAGYSAIGTSSQAVAISNGYEDGEQLPFERLLSLSKRVVELVRIPFTVDIEGGYARSIAGITNNIRQLADVGVVGINLEDSIPGASRKLQSLNQFTEILSAVADFISRNNLNIFLNVRTDGFLLGLPDALTETLKRIKQFENAGASGIFTPCITEKNDIQAVVAATILPINIMCMPNLPDFNELTRLGVKRISMGGFLFNNLYTDLGKKAAHITKEQSFSSLFS